MDKQTVINIVGAGLAGSECALYLAKHGRRVNLFDIKPHNFTPCHHSTDYGELVCSNSLKSNDVLGNACGLLKEELRRLGSSLIPIADKNRVPAGNALAVNRQSFSADITAEIKNNENISCFCKEISELDCGGVTVIATGPLTTDALCNKISGYGNRLFFFDAAAPIVAADSVDKDCSFVSDRYGQADVGDYLNCPLDKDQYTEFYNQLVCAERAPKHEFENNMVFEGCMPVEVMAMRGFDTLRFGPMKPAGLTDPKTGRWPFACVQLRKENVAGDAFNLVGFQTNLLFNEQKRVFSLIPALKNAEFLRYGVMHKNTYIYSPDILTDNFRVKDNENLYFAGQITGVEGYVESIGSGLCVAIDIDRKLSGKEPILFGTKTVLGALSRYVVTPTSNFQPMNANYGILEQPTTKYRDKTKKKEFLAEESLKIIDKIALELNTRY